jgi:hypothetical protein
MIISGLIAIVIACAAVARKLRSNTRELDRALWVQWRRG